MTDSDTSVEAGRAPEMPGLRPAASEHRRREGLRALVEAWRPRQWPKNLVVFAALVFSAEQAWELESPGSVWPLFWRTAALAACWCLVSSAVYLVNDLCDREADRLHPRKAGRPIARGAVSPSWAVVTAVAMAAAGVAASAVLDLTAGAIVAAYLLVMTAYSLGLKAIPVLDILLLSGGVVARAVAGAAVIEVTISPWLYVCTSFGALFLGVSKRWAEYRQLGAAAADHRQSLGEYSGPTLEHMLMMSGAGALLSYALYTIEAPTVPENGAMALTLPFVVFGLFRYMLLITGGRAEDAPDQVLFTDGQIVASVAGFLAVAVGVLAWA